MEIILRIESLKAGYKKKSIINDISFSISKGQTIGLIGLNGAGKTTLIKAITGLIAPYGGTIKTEYSEIAYLPENFEPPAFLSGMEYIRFCLKCYKLENVKEDEIFAAAALVSLAQEALSQKIKTYSKGMRQKLGVLANYLTKCPFMILDEPMSGLDPKAHSEVKTLIKKAKSEGITILMSIHNLHDLEALCDEVLFIHKGRLHYSGKVSDMRLKVDQTIEQAFLDHIAA